MPDAVWRCENICDRGQTRDTLGIRPRNQENLVVKSCPRYCSGTGVHHAFLAENKDFGRCSSQTAQLGEEKKKTRKEKDVSVNSSDGHVGAWPKVVRLHSDMTPSQSFECALCPVFR